MLYSLKDNESFDDFFDLTLETIPPAELKVAIGLSPKNPCGTIYEIISVLNSIFDENMNANY